MYIPSGKRYPNDNEGTYEGVEWEGFTSFDLTHTDRLGMLLDFDNGGSMTVFKNDVLVGVMQSTELAGNFCWSLEIADTVHVRIASAQIPQPHEVSVRS